MIQTIITHNCTKCGSTKLVKNGHDYKGSQKYACKACGSYGTLLAKGSDGSVVEQQVKRAVLERVSLRGISRIFGVSRPTVMRWIEAWATTLPALTATLVEAETNDVLELDEIWSFVGKKAQQRWGWVALCRRTRQIVAYFLGERTVTSCLHLWRQLPHAYGRCRSFSDYWDAYTKVFDPQRHQSVGKNTGQTAHIERWFNTLRQRLARFVRKSLSFSKSDKFHALFFQLFVHHYNLSCIS